jgi:predicted Zn-dependent protease
MVRSRIQGVMSGLMLTCVGLVGCTTNPETGERFFNTLSTQQEAQIGEQAAPELTEQFGGKVADPELQAYVTEVGSKLSTHTNKEFHELNWEFTLLDSAIVNAFALPGGKVFMSRGLMEKMNSEAQLAGVLGHEIGHVAAQHTARRIGQATILNAGLAAAGLAVGMSDEASALRKYGQIAVPALAIGGNLYVLKFGRDEESQADRLGMKYMAAAGYNPRAQLQVMEILKAEGGRGGAPEFLSTHPMPETRIRQIEGLLQEDEFRSALKNPYHEERFQQALARLRRLPPPKQQAPPQENVGSLREGQSVISRPRPKR